MVIITEIILRLSLTFRYPQCLIIISKLTDKILILNNIIYIIARINLYVIIFAVNYIINFFN